MPITTPGKSALQNSINSAFAAARDSGSQDGADSDAIVSQLSIDITEAIDAYVKSMVVQINPGGTTATGDVIVTPQLS
jgi:hypothetical protein